LRALIKTPYPMKTVIAEAQFIAESKVLELEAEKKRLVIEVSKDLKGKLPFRRLNVNLASPKVDDPEKKGDDPDKLIRRLRQGLPVVLFALRKEKDYSFLGFSEGTWFSMSSRSSPPPQADGESQSPPPAAVCAFGACEVYLRRTFAGSTKELLALLPDVLARKREPPPWNEKEPPGLGPELPPEKPGPPAEK
jgi:hypothetical protein